MSGERRAAERVATKDNCGKYLYVVRRAAAQEKSRLRGRGVHVVVYPCPVTAGGWHVGHDPQDRRNGTVSKETVEAHREHARVTAHAPYVGAPVTVTWNDPRAAARVCDALEAAADALEQIGSPTARQYRQDAYRLADALDRAAVPPT